MTVKVLKIKCTNFYIYIYFIAIIMACISSFENYSHFEKSTVSQTLVYINSVWISSFVVLFIKKHTNFIAYRTQSMPLSLFNLGETLRVQIEWQRKQEWWCWWCYIVNKRPTRIQFYWMEQRWSLEINVILVFNWHLPCLPIFEIIIKYVFVILLKGLLIRYWKSP